MSGVIEVEILHVAHSVLELNKREVVFRYENAFRNTVETIGLKYDLSKDDDRLQFQQIAWLTDVMLYEEELRGKTLRAIIEYSNNEIKALGHRHNDCFFIVNGDNEVMSCKKCLQQLECCVDQPTKDK